MTERALAVLRAIRRSVDVLDVAVVVGLGLLWVGLGKLAEPLPWIVVGGLCVAYGALPVLAGVRRRG